MNQDYFTDLAAYTRWADQKAMSWLAAIDDQQWDRQNASSFSSVKQTAIHIASAQKVWVDFWTGVANPVYLSGVFAGNKNDLLAIWHEAGNRLYHFISSHPLQELTSPVMFVYPNGRVGQMSFAQSFAHVVNHTTYHRGQLVTLLRQAGYSAFTSTDLATYYLINAVGEE